MERGLVASGAYLEKLSINDVFRVRESGTIQRDATRIFSSVADAPQMRRATRNIRSFASERIVGD